MRTLLRIVVPAGMLAVFFAISASRAQDADAVKDRLERAKREYDAELEKFRRTVTEMLDAREDAARKAGNKKAVDAVKAVRDSFAKDGQAPADSPRGALMQIMAAREKLGKAYSAAIGEFVRLKDDEAAAAVEKEQDKAIVEAALAFGRRAHLATLNPTNVKVWNKFFQNDVDKYKMGDEAIPHSILMHPPDKSYASASYALGGKGSVFRSAVGVPRHDKLGNPPATPLVFEVLGDDKTLWKSKPVGRLDKFQTCEVRIDKVKTLTLKVSCPGENSRAHAVWFGPVVIE